MLTAMSHQAGELRPRSRAKEWGESSKAEVPFTEKRGFFCCCGKEGTVNLKFNVKWYFQESKINWSSKKHHRFLKI